MSRLKQPINKHYIPEKQNTNFLFWWCKTQSYSDIIPFVDFNGTNVDIKSICAHTINKFALKVLFKLVHEGRLASLIVDPSRPGTKRLDI